MAGEPRDFAALVQSEHDFIDGIEGAREGREDGSGIQTKDLEVADAGTANEPWLQSTVKDYFGLALSGGGIRSATYNLGLLQALDQQGILKHVDYLATVSGGGYIGGFWTAWRQHHPGDTKVFPRGVEHRVNQADDHREVNDQRESAHIRHLREFSRFLMPRVGIAHSETWAGVVAILGGLIPSLCTALALLAGAMYLWFGATVWLLADSARWAAPIGFALITFGLHSFMERGWRKAKTGGGETERLGYYLPAASLAAALSALGLWGWRAYWQTAHSYGASDLVKVWTSDLEPNPSFELVHSQLEWVTLGVPLAWAGCAIALLMLRAVTVSRLNDTKLVVRLCCLFDRTIARLLAPAVVCAALALVWIAAARLREHQHVPATAVSAAGLAALFVWFRDWLAKPIVRTRGSVAAAELFRSIKPLLPQLLANVAFVGFLLGTCMLVQMYGLRTAHDRAWGVAGSAGVLITTLLLFNPARIGMHDFYRSRIARCFLGAARAHDPKDTQSATAEQSQDDMTFSAIRTEQRRGATARPLHLVCCAANNLSGDVLGSLYRGARSAVLSPVGVSIGGDWTQTSGSHDLRLSSALTASAAAFNSQMGSVSMALGPAVAFLMSALNLRLGLWVPHPVYESKHRRYWFPGWPFFLEMLGLTTCGPATTATKLGLLETRVHLSDGGHFENLALYELVRRHCRYLIVSDCGADPDCALGDLGNAVRRIREDFGVEIELDTTPLRPDSNGRSVQHAVVGTIHYDGVTGTDKGMLIYFKPTLTGDEPPDILQYRVRRSKFPHETTGDQFYDEAQWESYRRLGEHAVHAAVRQTGRLTSASNVVDRLFLEASQRWHPRPERHNDLFLALTERYIALESDIRREAPPSLCAEYFSEIAEAFGGQKTKLSLAAPRPVDDRATPAFTDSPEWQAVRTLYFLTMVLQLMEDVWVGLELETYWSHPLNEGWMNYFQRWASTPSLRRWWPILRPLYSVGFRDFVRDRFELHFNADAHDRHGARLVLTHIDDIQTSDRLDGLALQQWSRRYSPPDRTGKNAFIYELSLEEAAKPTLAPIHVGFLLYDKPRLERERVVEWAEGDLFVPQYLNGSGIVARFLDAVIEHFADTAISEIHVTLDEQGGSDKPARKPRPERGRDPAGRRDLLRRISFYKSRGFTYLSAMHRNVLKLDLVEWRKARLSVHAAEQDLPGHTGTGR